MIYEYPAGELVDTVFDYFKAFLPPKGGWIAGGALRAFFAREPIKDIDVFFSRYGQHQAERKRLAVNFGYSVLYDNPKVTRLSLSGRMVDLIKMRFDSPVNTLEAFDFTVSCAALSAQWDGKSHVLPRLFLHEDFFVHLAARRLVLNAVPFPAATIVRLQRYINKGYRICPEESRKLALACNSVSREQLLSEELYHSID